ncbi:replication factor C large subunit [Candidatus Halobonum tyrrellensis]|uniref:Replication factor C large subunit n=1 Tax=Candidatus Halobonum tyrrellensis G22 TaxID=1324957 RepID=V4HAN2_9EURY|nr:replication factor C large subunit [Candidatus Halobonum tyrrellensis]ESP87765.1 replication factor C large subunit [Candidatus Halobonum tyrrellensis G22]
MTDWTEKYRPRSLAELRGNDKAVDAFREWAESWDDHREAVVLHGSPGVGKTSAAHALAADMGWETVELNASDQRTADVIERYAGRAANNATLGGSSGADDTGGRQLIVMDEADNIHGNYDRGGAGAVTSLVKDAGQPIVLIANEYYDMSRGLRNATREIEFRDVGKRSIVPVLRDLCRKEGIEFDADALERIAERNAGDLRGAVNDLQAVADGRDRVELEDVVTGDRDRSMGIFPFLDLALKEADSAREVLHSSYDVDETPDDLTKWLEDNMLKVYDRDEAVHAYDHLADADVWLGRVRATQDYSYWRYAGDNLAGVAAAREGTKGGWTRWGRPQFYHSSSKTADHVVRKLATAGGVSMTTARRELLPFLAAMTHHCKPRDFTVRMAAAYDLDESHVSFVTGSGETTNKVESVVADAAAMREELVEEHAGGAFAGTPAAADDGETDGDSETDDGSVNTDADDGSADADGGPDEAADERAAGVDGEEGDDSQTSFSDF